MEGKCEVVNTFGFDQRFVGSAGGAQDVGGVGLVLGRLERSPRHVAGPGLGLPDLVSGGQEPLVHETLGLPSVITLLAAPPRPGPAGRGQGGGRVGLVGRGVSRVGRVVTEGGMSPPLSPGAGTGPPPVRGVLRLAPHPPERGRGGLGPLPVARRAPGGAGRPAVPGERVEPAGGARRLAAVTSAAVSISTDHPPASSIPKTWLTVTLPHPEPSVQDQLRTSTNQLLVQTDSVSN